VTKNNLKVYGQTEMQKHSRLEINFKPCVPDDSNKPRPKKRSPCGSVDYKNHRALTAKLRQSE
jgi:hypothetical protein